MPVSSACGPIPNADLAESVSTQLSSTSVRMRAWRLLRGNPVRCWSSDSVRLSCESARASRMRTVRSADLTS